MKTFLTLLLGAVVGAQTVWIILPHTDRYRVHVGDGFMVKYDTATGRTWREVDIDPGHEWYLIEDSKESGKR